MKGMTVSIAGNVTHEIKVTKLKTNLRGVRCFTNNTLNQEIRVRCREDIGVAAAHMLRWEDKCGNHSEQATASRNRFHKGLKFRGFNLPFIKVSV